MGTMKTKHYVLQIFRAVFTDRLLLIIVVLMIASLFAVLPIKSCSNPPRQAAGKPQNDLYRLDDWLAPRPGKTRPKRKRGDPKAAPH
ncbi:hypothetical protein N185_01455 [Sinorhizobium sp. GW3]|nr:hypothetical protein N185_01455 [Sinorhizobium sp. GW3]